MPDLSPLDNPIWNALNSEHSALALGDGRAKRYPADIGPLSGLADQSPASYEALGELAGPAGTVVLFLTEPPLPPFEWPRLGWKLIRGGELNQMICTQPQSFSPRPMPPNVSSRLLTSADAPEMVALAELTEPGPFRHRTVELGVFYGIFDSGHLVAMAGQRLHLPHFVEVSAVCTHPDARGRGYARALMSQVIDEMRQRGKTPILHTFADNRPAIRVYESLGFRLRKTLHLAVLKNEA
jgi:ribosomal protein S18 acetylase RimI-like enzyme